MTCNHRRIPGIEEFRDFVDVDNPYPLSFLDQYSLAELAPELALVPSLDNSSFKRSASADGSITGLIG